MFNFVTICINLQSVNYLGENFYKVVPVKDLISKMFEFCKEKTKKKTEKNQKKQAAIVTRLYNAIRPGLNAIVFYHKHTCGKRS